MHHRHHPAAARPAGSISALPGGSNETARLAGIKRGRGIILQSLEGRADIVAQALEPGSGACLAFIERGNSHCDLLTSLVPTFRSSCSIAAPTFTNFGKSWALANLLILVPLYRSEVPDRIRRLWSRDFRSAVLVP